MRQGPWLGAWRHLSEYLPEPTLVREALKEGISSLPRDYSSERSCIVYLVLLVLSFLRLSCQSLRETYVDTTDMLVLHGDVMGVPGAMH